MPPPDTVALVTGAAQGIGRAIADRLAADGYHVAVADLDAGKAGEAAEAIRARGDRATAIEMDAADEGSIEAGVAKLSSDCGPVLIAVNNAGIYASAKVMELELAKWQLALDLMLTGPLLVARAVIPAMREARWGRIVNLGSLVSQVSFGEDAAYAATKAGVLGLTRSLAVELGPDNICVNAICPGNIRTAMLEKTARHIEEREGMEPGSFIASRHEQIPLRRLGEPQDIANVISFLCSADAGYVSGQSIHVNGCLYQH